MKTTYLKVIIIGIVLICFVGCKPDKKPIEKIVFPISEFVIKSNSDTTLFCEQGTRIFIGAETFQHVDGRVVEDSIKVEVKEFYKKADIVLADLATTSNGRLLETGGMVLIEAFAGENKIEIKSDKRIVVHLPKAKNDFRKMNLFYADNTSTDTSVNNWEIDTINLVKKTLKLGSFGWWHINSYDSTRYSFIPKNYIDTGYYWNPLDYYVSSYDFSESTIQEIETTLNRNTYPDFDSWNDYGVECEMYISSDGDIRKPKIVTNVSKAAKKEIIQFLDDLPELEPGRNKYGDITVRRGLLFIQGGKTIPLYKTDEEYVKSFNAKYAQYEDSPIKNMDEAEMNYYIFSVSKLGWINCDYFIDSEEQVDLIVEEVVSSNVELKMVFSDIDGVIKPNIMNGKYVFKNVPKGKKATIFGLKRNDGDLLASFEELVIDEGTIEPLSFSEISLKELKEKLESI